MKKLIALFLCLCLMAGIVPVMAENTAVTHEITSSDVPLYMGSVDLGTPLTLYFLDGVDDLPYLEINDLNGLLYSVSAIPYSIKAEGSVVSVVRDTPNSPIDDGAYAAFDFDKDTITFSDFDLFIKKADATTVIDLLVMPITNAQGEPSVMQRVNKESLDRYGDALVVRCGDYGIDLVSQDGKYLVPLQTINDFFLWPAVDKGLFYNSKILIFADQIVAGDELYYSAPARERSAELTAYGYNELCMMLDYLYGLKDAHGIESFDKLFRSVTFDRTLKGESVANADLAINHLIKDYFDDGHSDWKASSWMAGSIKDDVDYGTSVKAMFAETKRYEEARKKYYPDGIPGYEEIGNTAYITFDSFGIPDFNTERYYLTEDVNSFDDTDTIGLIMKAHAMITRENSPIENVVLDLSNNGGGVMDTAIFTIAWLLGEASVGVNNVMTGAMCSAVYRADANRDRKFDEKDTVADKRVFCLISPVSFSCGNLVPCMLKESQKATLLGRTSCGGSCGVQKASSAWGSSFRISGPKRFSFLKNGSFYDIDRGADPDYQISTPEKFYDRQALTEYINSLY